MEAFPHFLGHADEKGMAEGEGYNLNYPMPPNTTYHLWKKNLNNAISNLKKFSPNFLLISLGVDTFEKDPISFFKLKSNDYFDVGGVISSLDIPTLFVMEGGYAINEIGVNTVNILKGFEE